MKKNVIFCLMTAVSVIGCVLEDGAEIGDKCPPEREISSGIGYIMQKSCTADACELGDYSYHFENGVCPSEYSHCQFDGDEYFCTNQVCEPNQHIYNNMCENDSLEHCGSHDNNCKDKPGWESWGCDNGICVLEECKGYYELVDNKCELKCPSGMHEYHGTCEANSDEHCGSHDKNCENELGWKSGSCVDGICVPEECKEYYELADNKCEFKCPSGMHEYHGTCEADSDEHCGAHEHSCSTMYANGVGMCVEGECQLYNCSSDFHEYDGGCESDSNSNCGSHGYSCTANSSCVDKKCVCKTRYHKYGDICELNADKHCGAHNTVCTSEKKCKVDTGKCECPENKHAFNDKCEKDTTDNCGAHGVVCSKVSHGTRVCIEGECSFNCDSTYHRYGRTCEKNDKTNCGAHGAACTTAVVPNSKSVTCSADHHSGECRASKCISGCKKSDGACILK